MSKRLCVCSQLFSNLAVLKQIKMDEFTSFLCEASGAYITDPTWLATFSGSKAVSLVAMVG